MSGINPISGVGPQLWPGAISSAPEAPGASGKGKFGDLLKTCVDRVDQDQQASSAAVHDLLTGKAGPAPAGRQCPGVVSVRRAERFICSSIIPRPARSQTIYQSRANGVVARAILGACRRTRHATVTDVEIKFTCAHDPACYGRSAMGPAAVTPCTGSPTCRNMRASSSSGRPTTFDKLPSIRSTSRSPMS